MPKDIVASIIATSQEELEQRINKVKDSVNLIQLDIMDNTLTLTSTLNFDFTLPQTECTKEAHLMLKEPKAWIENKADFVDTIIFHIEGTDNTEETIALIKQKGKKVGIAISPETSVEKLTPYLDKIDQVLVFTAEKLGYYGAPFSKAAIEKIKKIRELNKEIIIEVDGGVSPENIKELSDAGVNLFVVGSYLQKSENLNIALSNLKQIIGD